MISKKYKNKKSKNGVWTSVREFFQMSDTI